MREEIVTYANRIYKLRDLIRYNNSIRIKDESVAEHSAFVTLIVLELRRYYEFNLKKALIMAITHDLPEVYVSDVQHNVSKMFPKIKEAITDAEKIVWEKYFGKDLGKLNDEFNTGETTEGLIVQLADIISCIQYSQSEIKLGNEGYMREVYEGSVKRMEEIMMKLDVDKIGGREDVE